MTMDEPTAPTTTAPTAPLRVEDVQAAFRWIRRELVRSGCADSDREAGDLEAQIDAIETDVMGFLTDRARITRSA